MSFFGAVLIGISAAGAALSLVGGCVIAVSMIPVAINGPIEWSTFQTGLSLLGIGLLPFVIVNLYVFFMKNTVK